MNLFDVLILASDGDSRAKLKQAALSSAVFKQVRTVASVGEALAKIEYGDCPDLVFISATTPEAQIEQLLSRVAKVDEGGEITRVLLVKKGDSSNESLLKRLSEGIHGFVFVPYSADDLRQVAELAARVKAEAQEKRVRAMMKSMVADVFRPIRAMVILRTLGKDYKKAKIAAAQAVQFAKELSRDQREVYVGLIFDHCERSTPEKVQYEGPSERVKHKMLAKLMAELGEYAPDESPKMV